MSTKAKLDRLEERLDKAEAERPAKGTLVVTSLDDGSYCTGMPDFRCDERGLPTGSFAPEPGPGIEFYSQEELDALEADGWLLIIVHYVDARGE